MIAMSQYNSMPSPGVYVPPSQGSPAQSQGAQQPSSYQPNATNYGAQYQSQKGGGTFGQMMNQRLEQAVTTGKPMLNKLGKTISSKLGNKPSGGPPQHLQSYQSYQTHFGQQSQNQPYQQPQGQAFSPQPQQQQWAPPQQQPPPQAPNAYPPSQQSPYQQSSYSTPASGHSGQTNYFPSQTTQAPNTQSHTPQSPLTSTGHTSWQYGQGGGIAEHTQIQGYNGQNQAQPGQPQAPVAQPTQESGQYTGQQMGVVGGSHVAQHTPPPQTSTMSPGIPAQVMQPQWEQATGQQSGSPTYPTQQNTTAASPPPHSQHQWNSPSPGGAYGQGQSQVPAHSVSPPPTQPMTMAPHVPSNKPAQSSQSSTPAPHQSRYSAPHEFIAELPADLGNLAIAESKPKEHESSISGSQYQAFHPSLSPTGSPSPGFTIPRRSFSVSTIPLADPWRFADAITEVPTREFYILADLLFDALDRKFEPKNTGLLEAPKIIGSWVKLTEDACRECLNCRQKMQD
ncbi:hypothetical protein J4E93_010752 [Alternaria ventricosa]|uniref:uncharacterized protein n=1 Tax=Alternaria ventricosa TaxID=1187951 RepID=UPI0020C3EBC7|nr:uncharacterized protein J4E93_010752 [Alternaria ventricosa]KAI4636962.1 hypothetical protein J4E93_010752 [Alternaria ventricosa]